MNYPEHMVWALYKKMNKTIRRLYKRIRSIGFYEYLILFGIILFTLFIVKFAKGTTGEWKTIAIEFYGKNWNEDWTDNENFKPPTWLLSQLNVGDIELSPDGEKIAEIISIDKFPTKRNAIAVINIKAIKERKTNTYVFKNNTILPGSFISFIFNNASITGNVIDINVSPDGYEEKLFRIKARIKNMEPFIIEKIQIGDSMKNLSTNTIMAEIKDIHTSPSTSSVLFTNLQQNTKLILEQNPNFRDVYLTLDVLARKINNSWCFITPEYILQATNKNTSFLDMDFSNYSLYQIELLDIQSIE